MAKKTARKRKPRLARDPAECKHAIVRCEGVGRPAVIRSFGGLMPDDDTVKISCWMCATTLPLGPSNDSTPEVQVEMRAAEIALEHARIQAMFSGELLGYYDHRDGFNPRSDADTQWYSGWLAREMSTLDEADAWPWDPTRRVAGQFGEHLRAALEAASRELPLSPDVELPADAAEQEHQDMLSLHDDADPLTADPDYDPAGEFPDNLATATDCPEHPGADADDDGDCIECSPPTADDYDRAWDEHHPPIETGRTVSALADGIVEAGGTLPYLGATPDASGEPWSCPVASNECAIRRECTNKCGRKDPAPTDEARWSKCPTAMCAVARACIRPLAECKSEALAVDVPPALPTDGDLSQLPVLDIESMDDAVALRLDALGQIAHDKPDADCNYSIVELFVGDEPEQGVEFEVLHAHVEKNLCEDFACRTDGSSYNPDEVTCTTCGRSADSAEIAAAKWWTKSAAGWRCAGCNAPSDSEASDRAVALGRAQVQHDDDEKRRARAAVDPAIDALEYELTRAAEPDCRDEDGPEVERIIAEMGVGRG